MSETNEIMTIQGIDCFEQDGTAYLRLETVARGLGFTETAASGNETVRWRTVRKYLEELGIATCCDEALPDFIPENVFYRLAMKAKNETAEKFQALVADEIIPSIRKHGAYMTKDTLQAALLDPDVLISLCRQLKDERERGNALSARNSVLTVENALMQPKADYFDELVDRNMLTNLRDTAKELGIPPKQFNRFLMERKYIYRDKHGKLMPYAAKNDGLFAVKECYNDKTKWTGVQTLVTPKGRETFRLLCADA